MAIKSKAQLIQELTASAQRMQHVREVAETERVGQQFTETEPRAINVAAVQAKPSLQK